MLSSSGMRFVFDFLFCFRYTLHLTCVMVSFSFPAYIIVWKKVMASLRTVSLLQDPPKSARRSSSPGLIIFLRGFTLLTFAGYCITTSETMVCWQCFSNLCPKCFPIKLRLTNISSLIFMIHWLAFLSWLWAQHIKTSISVSATLTITGPADLTASIIILLSASA